ncbi:cation transporter [Candidatus Saganbacteria bacterium]|nr:cation transporter [Candidatus Saganbacteria bacterium]
MHEHRADQKPLFIALSITFLMMIVEFAGGLLSNSLALVSDAGHMLTDTSVLALALLAFYISRKAEATPEKTFGYHRLEILSALFNGAALLMVAGVILFESYQRYLHPAQVHSQLMLVVAAAGLLANLLGAWVLSSGRSENLNIKAAFWHILSDAVSSVGVIVGGLIIYFTGWQAVDPILGALIALLIIRGACDILSEAVEILLEATPRDIKLDEVIEAVKGIEGVRGLHDVHIWTITSGFRALAAHVEIEDAQVSACGELLEKINRRLHDKFNIDHATLQLECRNCSAERGCISPHKH